MKILCFIDHFGSGGAQRQMVYVARGLKERGHDIEICVFRPEYTFFRAEIELSNIKIHEFDKGSGFSLKFLIYLKLFIKNRHYDVILSYLNNPNLYAELALTGRKKTKLVVSERSSHINDKSKIISKFRRIMHGLSDHIVINSYSHTNWIEQNHFWLKGKVTTIYNGLDIESLKCPLNIPNDKISLKLLAIGRIDAGKNVKNTIRGLIIFYRKNGWVPSVRWVGRRDITATSIDYWNDVNDLLSNHPEIKYKWEWYGESKSIKEMLDQTHALIHPSFYEGLPNVICEALAAGKPVLASNVCDNSNLVKDGERGFTFNPKSPNSISNAIEKLVSLNEQSWVNLSSFSYEYALNNLSLNRMINDYEKLFLELVN